MCTTVQVWIAPGTGLANGFLEQLEKLSQDSTAIMMAIFAVFALVHSGLAYLRPYGTVAYPPFPAHPAWAYWYMWHQMHIRDKEWYGWGVSCRRGLYWGARLQGDLCSDQPPARHPGRRSLHQPPVRCKGAWWSWHL